MSVAGTFLKNTFPGDSSEKEVDHGIQLPEQNFSICGQAVVEQQPG